MSLLGIDLGTSSVKIVLTDREGAVLAQAGAEYPVDRRHPGWAETDPEAWWSAIVAATGRALAAGPGDRPEAIGLSGQMHGLVLCDADRRPVRPALLWADARAEDQLGTYRALPPATLTRLANPLTPGMAGPLLGWLHAHEPASVAAARWALQPKDWVRARLTGAVAGEPSDASATLLYDVLADGWDGEVVAALGVGRELLPDLLPSAGALAGALRADAADALGLPAGIPVAAGAADTAAAAHGSGLDDPGTVQLTIGTGVQIVTPVPAPTADGLARAGRPVTHLYRAAGTGWYAMAAGITGGQTLGWVRRILGAEWAELYAAAGRGPQPGDPVFLPHLIGERTPYLDTHLRGSWSGLDARHDREALLYAALEGVAFAAADGFAALRATGAVTGSGARLAGGGTVAAAWRQLLADALRLTLRPVDVSDASGRGAALLGGIAAGLPAPAVGARSGEPVVPGDRAGVLRERHALYLDVLAALRPLPFDGTDRKAGG